MIICGGNSKNLRSLFKEHGAMIYFPNGKENLADHFQKQDMAMLITKGKIIFSVDTSDGKTHIAYCMGPDTVFEQSLQEGKKCPYHYHLTAAAKNTEVYLMPKETLMQLRYEDPQLCDTLDLDKESALRYIMEISNMFRYGDAERRTAGFLYAFADNTGSIDYSQSSLTRLLDLSTSQVWRTLTKFRKEGILTTGFRAIILNDQKALEKYLPDSIRETELKNK